MTAPTLITRESLAASAAERWRQQYTYEWDSKVTGGRTWDGLGSRDVHDRLVALGPTPKPDDVDRVIGNDSWTDPPTCHGCGLDDDSTRVMVGQESDYDSETATLCEGCVRAALAVFGRGAP